MSRFSNFSQMNNASLEKAIKEADKPKREKDPTIYPNPTMVDGEGRAVIRFLPVADFTQSPTVKVYRHYLKKGKKWVNEVCPRTIDKPCPICEAGADMWDDNDKSAQAQWKMHKARHKYACNIYVIKDERNPDAQGKVMKYLFPDAIMKLIDKEFNPEVVEEGFGSSERCNVFDPIVGKNFLLATSETEGTASDGKKTKFFNYDKSEFQKVPSPLFKDESKLDEIFDQLYDIHSTFLNENDILSYDELKSKYEQFMGSQSPTQSSEPELPQEVASQPAKKEEKKDDFDLDNLVDSEFEVGDLL